MPVVWFLAGLAAAGLVWLAASRWRNPGAGNPRPEDSPVAMQALIGAAFDGIDHAVSLYDADDRLVAYNRRFPGLFRDADDVPPLGSTYEKVLKTRLDAGVLMGAASELAGWMKRRIADHHLAKGLEPFQTADGRWSQVVEFRVPDGGILHIIGDVTARVGSDSQERGRERKATIVSRAKREFLTNMGHQLRTPLNTIIGFSEMVKDEAFGPLGNEKYEEYAADIHEAGGDLMTIIADIIEVARIEADALDAVEEAVDVNSVVHSCLRMVGERAARADIRLSADLPDKPPRLMLDETRFRQVLLNLLSNALRFTPPGGGITVSAAIDERGGYRFVVGDTGVGIAKRDLDKALAPFGQINDSESFGDDGHGSGLGLTIAKSIMEMHGGALELDSEPNRGTRVKLSFPADRTLYG